MAAQYAELSGENTPHLRKEQLAMETIFEIFSENLAAFLIVFVILFVSISYLFAKDKFLSMIIGLLRLLASFFYSPFVYIKRAVVGLAEYGTKGEAEFSQSKQYLLNKLMISLQGLLVVLSVAVLAVSLVSGWNQMLPPKPLQEQIGSLEGLVGKQQSELGETGPKVKQMEADWTIRRDSLTKAYALERTKKSETVLTENADLAGRISQLGDTVQQCFLQIRDYYSQNEYQNSASQFERVNAEVRDYIGKLDVSDAAKGLMHTYNDNWYFLKLSGLEMSGFSESQLRSALQPAYNTLKKRLDYINEILPSQETELAELKKEAKYDIEALLLQILYGLLQFILLVWVAGLFIESLWLAIHIGANVEKIQDSLAKK